MSKKDIYDKICECKKCGHSWLPRIYDEPKICPSCKSKYWDEDDD